MVEYHPFSTRDQSRLHHFGKNVLLGIYLGCELIAGRIWKGNILIADLEELEKLDAPDIYPRRINAKEVLIPQKGEEFTANGTAKLLRGDYEFQESTLRRVRFLPWASRGRSFFFQKMVWFFTGHAAHGLSPGTCDDSGNSICFVVYVDGVCAVGCDRPKVLAKATLDAAGLQCSEIAADFSSQVFTGLQLDHESGILSLEESRIWWLRHGLEFAACHKQLTGDQGA